MEVVPWPIAAHMNASSSWLPSLSPGDIHYQGQIPANNDCVYRYMYQSKYLLLHDPDEVILPTGRAARRGGGGMFRKGARVSDSRVSSSNR